MGFRLLPNGNIEHDQGVHDPNTGLRFTVPQEIRAGEPDYAKAATLLLPKDAARAQEIMKNLGRGRSTMKP